MIVHHTLLGYHPFAPPPNATLLADPRIWPAFPVVDAQRSIAASLIVGFNEAFFMSLMFLLSGLFAWQSIQRRGAAAFIRTRVLRLGLPFAVGSLLLAPLAYYPAYLQTTARATSPASGTSGRRSVSGTRARSGSSGCFWRSIAPPLDSSRWRRVSPPPGKSFWARTSGNSFRFFATLTICSLAVYLPMAVTFSSISWWAYGPFTVQTSRIFHYALYFLVGVALGGTGLDGSILRDGGPLSRRWIVWPIVALVAFAVAAAITIAAVTAPTTTTHWEAIGSFGFVLSCAASSCALLALFLRFVRRSTPAGDSVRDNAYGIYLLHYAFVSWLLYALVPSSIGALPKAAIVASTALGLSWATSAALRTIPIVRRVV